MVTPCHLFRKPVLIDHADTAWEKRPVTTEWLSRLWRVMRVKLTRCNPPAGERFDLSVHDKEDKVTETKFFALNHVFWIKLSDFMDIVPRYPHLANVPISTGALADTLPIHPTKNGVSHNALPSSDLNGHHLPQTNGNLTNGIH